MIDLADPAGLREGGQDAERCMVSNFILFIQLRRDTSGCKPVFDLIEYSMDIDLPDFVIDNPFIMALNEGANDLVTVRPVCALHFQFTIRLTLLYPQWSNVSFSSTRRLGMSDADPDRAQDIFSYNVEQSRGDTHNVSTGLVPKARDG